MHDILLRRVGEADSAASRRVLVDRLWPRGVSSERADWDAWLKEVSPPTDLRQWYGHDPARWEEFAHRYRAQLLDDLHADGVLRLRQIAEQGPLTLLTSTRSVALSHLTVLREFLREHLAGG